MTRTGVFMRRAVRTMVSFHWAALSMSTIPDRSAATNTPVPAADSQLMTKRAASGLAPKGATGGFRAGLALRLEQEAGLGVPDEAQEQGSADDGENAGDHVGHQVGLGYP